MLRTKPELLKVYLECVKLFSNILITLCLTSLSAMAQNNVTVHSFKKDNTDTAVIQLTDSMPLEFVTNISRYTFICQPNTFELYEKKGNFDFVSKQFKPEAVVKPFFQPVNEITLMFIVNNSSAQEQTVYFSCGNPDLFKLCRLDEKPLLVQTGGFLGKTNRISPFSPNKYLAVMVPPKATKRYLAYVKFMGTYKEKVTPMLYSEKSYQLNSIRDVDKNRLQLIYHSFIIGGIFIISLFMSAQFLLNRDKTYLYYAGYGIFIFLVSEKIMEHNCGIALISYFFPTYVYYSHVILQLLASFFYLSFVTRLLNISQKEKAIDLCSSIFKKMILLGCILYCLTPFISEKSALASFIFNYGTLLTTLCMFCFLIFLLFMRRKDLAVKLVIAGFSTVVIASLLAVYINRSGLNSKFTLFAPVSIVEFGVFLEMIFFGLALGYKTQKQKEEKESIELQKKETEMAALKAQMNPHFMFNCINSIDAFIQSNDKYNATLYLNKFAKLIRNVLDNSKENTVLFSKDIDTLKLYTELEQLRSDHSFRVVFDVDEGLLSSDYKVPPLIVQPFIENAIIHGLRNKETKDGLLEICVSQTGSQIRYLVKDNGIGRTAAAKINPGKEKSYGMQMSRERIMLFNKEKNASVSIADLLENGEPAGTEVSVHLNII